MKHLAGVVLGKMQGAAKKITQNPKDSPHAKRMRQESDFYETWLLPKCQRLCESKGWQMTPVPYFSVGTSKVDQEQRPEFSRPMHSDTRVVLATATTPKTANKLRKRSGSTDDMSEISVDSSRFSRLSKNNPITQYLNNVEQKTQQRKAEYIAQFRQRAAERLAPHEFEATANSRLAQLYQAKARHSNVSHAQCPKTQTAPSMFFDQLKAHGPYTRVIVLSSLVLFLFLALNPQHLVHSLSISFDPEGPWHTLILREVGMIVYLFFCAMLHWFVCCVALVYAFDTLEVGSKSGKGIRDFYSENVVNGVLLCSLGIIAVSGLMASSVWINVIPWSIMRVVNWSSGQIDAVFSGAARALPPTSVEVLQKVATNLGLLLSIMVSCLSSVSSYLARGHSVMATFAGIIDSAESFHWKQGMVLWGNGTFSLAQTLYQSSATFLVCLVTLFHYFTERGSHVKEAFEALSHEDDVSSRGSGDGNRR